MSEPVSKHNELTDFSDRFSPMLVKELRQGLRTNVFVISFILLQAFMILCILMSSTESNSNSAASAFFWFFIVVSLLVVQPLRGFAALSQEFQLNTMDLIQMTRLNAWRIVWGKWSAINAQTLLLVTAIAPYLVLRYFFGSINIFSELGFLGLCALSSAMLSAMTVGCSALSSLIVRITLLIGVAVLFTTLAVYTLEEVFRNNWSPGKMKELGLLVFASLFGTYYFLAFGASKIAPGSENHSTRKRLIGLGCAIGAWAFQFLGCDDEVCFTIASIILGITVIDAITEPPPIFESTLRPFSKPWKRPWAYLLSPGWHTGILFFACLLIFWAFSLQETFSFSLDSEDLIVFANSAAMVTFPLIIIHLCFQKSAVPYFNLYLFIQLCLVLVAILVTAVAENNSLDDELVHLFVPLPAVIFFGNIEHTLNSFAFVIIGLSWLILSILIPLWRGKPLYRKMSETFRTFQK
jgi:hypothetical protein